MSLPNPEKVEHRQNKIRMILYGESGTGKTTASGSLIHHPQLANVLVLNFDRGQASLPEDDRLSLINIDLNGSYIDTLTAVVDELCKPPERRHEAYRKYNTVVIDSVSALKDQILAEVQGNKTRTFLTYNKMFDSIVSNIDRLITSNTVHLVLLAGSREEYNDGELRSVQPDMNPALWRAIRYRMDFIFYTQFRNDRYIIRTHLTGDNVLLKIRNKGVAEKLANHNFEFNKQILINSGVDETLVSNVQFEQLAYSMIADDSVLSRFYSVYLKGASNE